jgi:hypothetical protein
VIFYSKNTGLGACECLIPKGMRYRFVTGDLHRVEKRFSQPMTPFPFFVKYAPLAKMNHHIKSILSPEFQRRVEVPSLTPEGK